MVIALDYGEKRAGLAISDETEVFAFAIEPIIVKKNNLAEELIKKIEELHVDEILVGVPLGLDEKPTEMSKVIEKFAERLRKLTGKKVILWNETLTSKFAQNTVSKKNRKKKLDSESARIILQEYLENKKLN